MLIILNSEKDLKKFSCKYKYALICLVKDFIVRFILFYLYFLY